LQKIEDGTDDWEVMLPAGVAEIIKEKHLFSCEAPLADTKA
jgi:hypothetical protein